MGRLGSRNDDRFGPSFTDLGNDSKGQESAPMATIKEEARKLLERLPDEAPRDDLMDEI